MTTEEIIRAAAEMLRRPNPYGGPLPDGTWRVYEQPPRDPSAISFVKRDGVWEMPR